MDPDELLHQLLKNVEETKKKEDAYPQEEVSEEMSMVAQQVDDLDTWLCTGGFLPTRWADKCNGGLLAKAILAEEVARKLYMATNSYEVANTGVFVAYLLSAILVDNTLEVRPLYANDANFIRLVRGQFDPDHVIWEFISVQDEELKEGCLVSSYCSFV